MRALLLVILAAIAVAWTQPARAAPPVGGCEGQYCDTRETAYAKCAARSSEQWVKTRGYQQHGGIFEQIAPTRCHYEAAFQGDYQVQSQAKGGQWYTWETWKWSEATGCVPPEVWNDSVKQCYGPDECLSRNADLPTHSTVRTYANACVAGCRIKAEGPTVGVDGLYTGTYQYSGDFCTAGPTLPDVPRADDKKDPPQECTPAGGGMTFCLKPDGQQCYTSSNGRQNCWRVGETGVKDDGPVKQKRDAGTEAIPPNLNLPNGDVLQQTQGPKTQTTTVTNGGGNTTTVTTTTTNYTTVNGTNAGPKNEGESNTGDGSGKEGDGDSENGVSGGSCTAGYSTTGDPLLGAILQEEHKQRCAQEKLKSDMQADIAAGDGDDGAGSIWDTAGTPLAFNEGLVSLGGGGIPDLSFNVDGQSFAPFAGPTSDFIATLRWLIIAAATIYGLYIIWNR